MGRALPLTSLTKKDLQKIQALPRKVRRKIWRGWWKNKRSEIAGENRGEQRAEWRQGWGKLAMYNAPRYRLVRKEEKHATA